MGQGSRRSDEVDDPIPLTPSPPTRKSICEIPISSGPFRSSDDSIPIDRKDSTLSPSYSGDKKVNSPVNLTWMPYCPLSANEKSLIIKVDRLQKLEFSMLIGNNSDQNYVSYRQRHFTEEVRADNNSNSDVDLRRYSAPVMKSTLMRRSISEIPTPPSPTPSNSDSTRSRTSSLVEELLSEIYSQWNYHKYFGRSVSIDSDNISTAPEDSYYSITEENGQLSILMNKTSFIPPRKYFYQANNKKDKLLTIGKVHLASMVQSLQTSVQEAGGILIKELKRKDRLINRRNKQYDVITAILRATCRYKSPDIRIRFSVEPFPGDSGFAQWHDAMRMVAGLPEGIPAEFRKRLWLTLAERYLQARGVDWTKVERVCFNEWTNPDDDELGIQIVKDLHRTGCSLFCGKDAEHNQALLKRVLLGYARWNKSVGYCQGFNMLAALFLQVMERNETDALKVMIYLIEGVLPESYFANNLRGLSVDMAVFRDLLRMRSPDLSRHLEMLQHEAGDAGSGTSYEPPLTNVFTMQWFLTLFCNCLPQETVLRVWDLIFLEGNEVLLRTALAIWDVLGERVMTVESADEFYSIMGVLTREMLEFGLMDGNNLVKNIVSIAPFPFPELSDLRDKYTYNITPWTQTVSSAAKRGLKLFYSDDDDDDQDDEDKLALATAYGIASSVFRAPIRRRDSLRGMGGTNQTSSGNAMQQLNRGRINLDIAILKKQYSKLRERQKQAHIILTAACAREKPTPVPPSTVAMNHLLLGKKSLVTSKPRKSFPHGAIPVPLSHFAMAQQGKRGSRGRGAIVGVRGRGGVRGARVGPMNASPAPIMVMNGKGQRYSQVPPTTEQIIVQEKTSDKDSTSIPRKVNVQDVVEPPEESGETLRWKDERRERRKSIVGICIPTEEPVDHEKDLAESDDSSESTASSSSTELCDEEGDRLSDFELEEKTPIKLKDETITVTETLSVVDVTTVDDVGDSVEDVIDSIEDVVDSISDEVEDHNSIEDISVISRKSLSLDLVQSNSTTVMQPTEIFISPSSSTSSPEFSLQNDNELSRSVDSIATLFSIGGDSVGESMLLCSHSEGNLFSKNAMAIFNTTIEDGTPSPISPFTPVSFCDTLFSGTTSLDAASFDLTTPLEPIVTKPEKKLSFCEPSEVPVEVEKKFYERLTSDICRREFTLLQKKSELKDSTSDSDLCSVASNASREEVYISNSRRSSERAIHIIEENSKILERILNQSAKAERTTFYWSETSDSSSTPSTPSSCVSLSPEKKQSDINNDEIISPSNIQTSDSSSTLKDSSESNSSPTKANILHQNSSAEEIANDLKDDTTDENDKAAIVQTDNSFKSKKQEFTLNFPTKTQFNPFPKRTAERQPKPLGVKLGLYNSSTKSPS